MFGELFDEAKDNFSFKVEKSTSAKRSIEEAKKGDIEDVIASGIKVKSTIPSPVGTFYEFFSVKDAKEANEILKGKIDKTSVLVRG